MSDEALPPSDPGAERAVLAAAMLSTAAYREAAGMLVPDDFYAPAHAQLWLLMDELASAGKATDIATVYTALTNHPDDTMRRLIQRADPLLLPNLMSLPVVTESIGYHAEAVAAASQRRRLVAMGTRIVQRANTPGIDQVELIDWSLEQVKGVRDQRRGVEILTVGVEEFMSQTPEFSQVVIPELLSQGDRFVLTGSGGLGKSMMMWQLAICAASGTHPFNERLAMDPRRVTVIDRENTIRQSQQRIRPLLTQARRFGHEVGDNLRIHTRGQSMDLLNPTEAMSVLRTIEHDRPDLVYIGPAYKLHNDDPDKESVIKRVQHVLDAIREMGPAVMVEAHANKSESMAPSGSNIWSWWPEFGMGLKLVPGSDRIERHCALVRWRFERDDLAEWPEAVRAGGKWPWSQTTLPFNPDN